MLTLVRKTSKKNGWPQRLPNEPSTRPRHDTSGTPYPQTTHRRYVCDTPRGTIKFTSNYDILTTVIKSSSIIQQLICHNWQHWCRIPWFIPYREGGAIVTRPGGLTSDKTHAPLSTSRKDNCLEQLQLPYFNNAGSRAMKSKHPGLR